MIWSNDILLQTFANHLIKNEFFGPYFGVLQYFLSLLSLTLPLKMENIYLSFPAWEESTQTLSHTLLSLTYLQDDLQSLHVEVVQSSFRDDLLWNVY